MDELCEVMAFTIVVELAVKAIKFIVDQIKKVVEVAGDVISAVGDFFDFRRRMEETMNADNTCTDDHNAPCTDRTSATCFRPLHATVPDMEGFCMRNELIDDIKKSIRDSDDQNAPLDILELPLPIQILIYQTLSAHYKMKLIRDQSKLQENTGIQFQDVVTKSFEAMEVKIDSSIETIAEKVESTCKETSAKRNLKDINMNLLRGSDDLSDEAKEGLNSVVNKLGIPDKHLDDVLGSLFGKMKNLDDPKNSEAYRNSAKEALEGMGIDEDMLKNMASSLTFTGVTPKVMAKLTDQLMDALRDPETDLLSDGLARILPKDGTEGDEKLESEQDRFGRKLMTKEDVKEGVRALSDEKTGAEKCRQVFEDIKQYAVEGITEAIRFSISPSNTVSDILGDAIGEDFEKLRELASPGANLKALQLVSPFLIKLDVVQTSSLVYAPSILIADLFQQISAFMMFGCAHDDEECQDQLPVSSSLIRVEFPYSVLVITHLFAFLRLVVSRQGLAN